MTIATLADGLRETRARTFSSLHHPNYRRYTFGQVVSLCGTWMQTVGQGWLVVELSGSGTTLGLVVALQFLPLLLAGPYGGVIADRLDKRRLLLATQTVMGLLALTLGLLTVTHHVTLAWVYALAGALGIANVFDNPARQTFVLEMVGKDDLRNAVTLNSVIVNSARAVGPGVAGVLIAAFGVGACFLVNAASYLAVIAAFLRMDRRQLHPAPPVERAKGQLRDGLRYVAATPALRVPLVMMAVVGTLAYEFQVVLPLVARYTFRGGAGTYGLLTAAMGVGAVVGGLATAGARSRVGAGTLAVTAAVFGVVILAAAAAPTLALEVVALLFVGAASVAFLSTANTTLQLRARPDMRGRVMALWAVAFLGSTPVGGPLVGWVAEHAGPRYGLLVGGAACLLVAAWGATRVRRHGGAPSARAGEFQPTPGEPEPTPGEPDGAQAATGTPAPHPAPARATSPG